MRPGGEAVDVQAAYRHCEQITWSQARNFSYGIRLLPPAKRQALAAVYAFARRIDDIGDGTLPAPEKLTLLEEARDRLSALQAGDTGDGDEVLVALADAATRFDCALGGFSLPAPGDGSAGALPPPSLPAPGDGSAGALPPPPTDPELDKLTALVEFEADRARAWYAKGLALMPLLDRRSAASAGAMAGIYYRLLEHIAASPAAVLTRRLSLSTREKAAVAVKSLATAAVRPPRRRPQPPAAPQEVAR